MDVDQCVHAIRLHNLVVGDGVRQPPVIVLSGQLQHLTRHRDGDTVGGQLSLERVRDYPRGFTCERCAAARLSTPFLCSSKRLRSRSSQISAASVRGRPVLDVAATHPSPQRHWVNPEITSVLLDRHSGLKLPSDAHDVIAELCRIGLRLGAILPDLSCRASQIRLHLPLQHTRTRQRPIDDVEMSGWAGDKAL